MFSHEIYWMYTFHQTSEAADREVRRRIVPYLHYWHVSTGRLRYVIHLIISNWTESEHALMWTGCVCLQFFEDWLMISLPVSTSTPLHEHYVTVSDMLVQCTWNWFQMNFVKITIFCDRYKIIIYYFHTHKKVYLDESGFAARVCLIECVA